MLRKTHFEQVPVAIAEKAAKAESNGHSTAAAPEAKEEGLEWEWCSRAQAG